MVAATSTGSRGQGLAGDLDLLMVGVLTVLAALILAVSSPPGPLRWALATPLLILFPGYALVAALFPEAPDRGKSPSQNSPAALTPAASHTRAGDSPSWIARLALATLLSPILVASLGALLSPAGAISLGPVLVGLTAIVSLGLAIAWTRRRQLPPDRRATPLSPERIAGFETLGSAIGIHNRLLVLALVVLIAAVLFAYAAPSEGEGYTEAFLVADEETNGYPSTVPAGESLDLSVGLENNENRPMTYEVVTVAQRVDADGAILDVEQLDSFAVELADEEQTIENRSVTPTLAGESIRLQILVFEDGAPASPTADDADHALQLWLTVEEV